MDSKRNIYYRKGCTYLICLLRNIYFRNYRIDYLSTPSHIYLKLAFREIDRHWPPRMIHYYLFYLVFSFVFLFIVGNSHISTTIQYPSYAFFKNSKK